MEVYVALCLIGFLISAVVVGVFIAIVVTIVKALTKKR